MWQSPKVLNVQLLYDTAIPLLGIYLREMETCPHRDFHLNVHGSIIHNSPKVEKCKCVSIGELINKMWYTLTMEYCLAIKRNKLMTHTLTEMNLKNIILNKSS